MTLIKQGKYLEANQALQIPKFQSFPQVIDQLAAQIICELDNLSSQSARMILNQLIQSIPLLSQNDLIGGYLAVTDHLNALAKPDNRRYLNAIQSINYLIKLYEKRSIQIFQSLIEKKRDILIDLGVYYSENQNRLKAHQAYQQARALLPQSGRNPTEQVLITQLDALIR